MPKLLLTWLLIAASSLGLSAQQGTDFSGTWVLEESSAPSENIAGQLIIQQQARTLSVTRRFANAVRERSYMIGLVGGVTGGLPGGARTGYDWTVRWSGNSLWINERDYSGTVTSERSETWRLDDRGRLIISLEIRESGRLDAQRWTLAYRREG